jgi:hypothetical protein
MLDALTTVKWHLEIQPSWNAKDEVAQAIRSLALATEETGSAAYSRMLYAIGNNHAGTYFPVVLALVPFLGEILRAPEYSDAARSRALDVLIDLDLKPDVEAARRSPVLAKLADELLALLRD